jgi:DNA-binding NarL/FixJ family response regulator
MAHRMAPRTPDWIAVIKAAYGAAASPHVEQGGQGRLVDASAAASGQHARESLREAAIALDQACGRLGRTDAGRAVALWRALIAGRWSLVDQFDRDGRRFLLAQRNDAALVGAGRLTERERQVAAFAALGHPNKLIAYELGLSTTTVATHLSHAAKKLGLRSRAALIRALRGIGSTK